MSKHHKRLGRFMRLARMRGMLWASKHVAREAKNAQMAFRFETGKRAARHLVETGLYLTLMMQVDGPWAEALKGFGEETNQELSA